ncbi:cell division septation protein DedD [Rhodovulum sulfidophilum]|uniref:SPOR domain-containing protein n=1 Tax=Rhodovulum sulfidophilum TaxID=35806 RepID=UPI0005A7697F|nr:SPOR domain-containing protein [Rhodovulum sulfidophilum]ANB35460.1 hypothetical protein A6W98_16100 [Rhodovulum sulfidophilum DSM 1374]ANB39280.1 hypothetical protein A6024_15955 [Rhodovulum sulfidophilum]MCW2303488.1 cell division septation protein DedD [Rhodovulum sulfidophilum]
MRFPIYCQAVTVALALCAGGTGAVRADPVAAGAVPLQPPHGYREVWEDDRLNPLRGPRTEWGDAQMRRVWTEQVPQRLVDPARRPAVAEAPVAGVAAPGRRYIQVGAFTEAGAAAEAVADLRRLGLPARQGRMMAGDALVTVIFAGPFGDRDSMGRARGALVGAGYAPVATGR